MFKEMGGEIITVGSDSHRVSDLGKGIKEGLALAKRRDLIIYVSLKRESRFLLKSNRRFACNF